MVDDLELLDAWASGDRAAASTLLERHLDGLSRFFRGKVSGEVDDFIQEAFTRCLAQRKGLAPGSSFRAYLFAVARNLLYAHYRTVGRNASADFDRTSLADLAPNASAVLRHADEQRLMREALRTIPVESQLALELFYWEELSLDEIASVLEIPLGTVKSRLHRARNQLRRQLEQLGGDGPQLRASLRHLDEWDRRSDAEHRTGSDTSHGTPRTGRG